MNRREFLGAAAIAMGRTAAAPGHAVKAATSRVVFDSDNAKLQAAWDGALAGLSANVKLVSAFARPVLWEGAGYGGVWLECGPLEGLCYAAVSREVARANHEIFFELQREDGYLPCNVRVNRVGSAQIQMVVPIAATAWDLYQITRSSEFLTKAYHSCARWDAWLNRYRDTRGTGLCEAFCEYDTGHDNSPRFEGQPKRCPDEDARICPHSPGLPYLAPDLSASVYGGRIALATMAGEMGNSRERDRWLGSADAIRRAIVERLYDSKDGAFYDVDANDKFVRIRGDAITRVAGEHVPDRALFGDVYQRQLRNPHAFWSPYPFPSIALDDSRFVRPIPRNSWGGAAQALTALRAPRWMEHYGKYADLACLMTRWVDAIVRAQEFRQQMDPETGEFTHDSGGYSPAMLVLFDFVRRLYGVMQVGETLEWNCRLPPGAHHVTAVIPTSHGDAKMRTTGAGSVLTIGGKNMLKISGEVRAVTAADGTPRRILGTAPTPVTVKISRHGKVNAYTVAPDQIVSV